jgi:hypothetical protein
MPCDVRCTAVKATLLRSQPCAMLPRARQVALARSNLIFTMRRRSRKANCQARSGLAQRTPAPQRRRRPSQCTDMKRGAEQRHGHEPRDRCSLDRVVIETCIASSS